MDARFIVFAVGLIGTASSTVCAESLQIVHVDVDQGDATLFVSPSGNTMLVDSGKNGHGTRLRSAMSALGVTRIDHLVTTHYHEDHYGGADELLAGPNPIEIGEVHDRGDKAFLPPGKRQENRFLEYETALGHRAHHLMRGETIPLDASMVVTCIASGSAVLGEEPVHHGSDENDMSIALVIQYGDFRYFVGGDIESHTEAKIAERDLVMNVDVYQANHHASHTSSSAAFLLDMLPTLIVVSNGDHGGFRHPRQVTLNNYAGLNPAPTVLQLNKYTKGGDGGNVADEFIADLEPAGPGGDILLTVLPDGSYTATYRDLSRSFQARRRNLPSGPGVIIVSLLPDPIGSDRDLEEVELRNDLSVPVDMTGWFLRDASGRVWALASLGVIPPGEGKTIVRAGMAMSLDNDGDEIELLDEAGSVVDSLSYTDAMPGTRIFR
jgi:beta-lactamase superfamily II metal-dependent hydrolase